MLLLTAFIEVAGGDRDAIRAALPAVIASTRGEDGCLDYGGSEATQPGRVNSEFPTAVATTRVPSVSRQLSRPPSWRSTSCTVPTIASTGSAPASPSPASA